MDDILDSVHTVQEAQELTTGIDIVLEKGGFKVKEWQSNKDLSNNCDRQDGEINVLTGSVEDKVLGVVSNIAENSFKFKVKNEAIRNSELNQADKDKYPQSSSEFLTPLDSLQPSWYEQRLAYKSCCDKDLNGTKTFL